MGGITFVKTKNGYIARQKTSMNGDRIKTDAAYERTRENMAEFGTAAQAGKVIRTAFRPISSGIGDSNVIGRLQKQLMRAVKADPTNTRGARTAHNGVLGLLQGFNFNSGASLSSKLYVQPVTTIDRVTGAVAITVPPFAPGKMVSAPDGATHFQLLTGLAQIDFVTGNYNLSQARSEQIQVNSLTESEPELAVEFEPNTTDVLFLAFGIEFTQLVNGQQYPLNDAGFNALAILQVDQLAG
jgi:hypothetical protein